MKSTPKSKAWAAFSKYIRLRDAINTTGTLEYARCFTCEGMHPIKEMDAGHWIPRNRLGTFMDERNVHCQCRGCNRFGGGRSVEYQEHLMQVYGPNILGTLTEQARVSVKIRESDWKELEQEYKRRVKVIEEEGAVPGWSDAFLELLYGAAENV